MKHTVQRALKKLAALGLAEHSVAGWTRGNADLGKIANEYNAGERAAARRERHDREREAYRNRAGQVAGKTLPIGNKTTVPGDSGRKSRVTPESRKSNAVTNANETARFNTPLCELSDAEVQSVVGANVGALGW